MFGKTMMRALFVVAVATFLAGTAMAQVILPTLPPGSQFQILFVTSDGTTAISSNIADYDNFVTQEANQSPPLASLGATWTAVATVASSPTYYASQASSTTNVPLYDTDGDLLEPNFPSLFTDWDFPGPSYNQYGNPVAPPTLIRM